MKNVTVKKDELRAIIQTNRDAHRDIFEQAVKLYNRRLLEALEKRVERVRNGVKVDHYIRLPIPEDHTKDYDRILAQLDMEIADTVVIPDTEFAQYVMDDWSWKESFASNSASYLAGTARGGDDD